MISIIWRHMYDVRRIGTHCRAVHHGEAKGGMHATRLLASKIVCRIHTPPWILEE